ncbi:YciI family protein [Paenibacillus sp. MBLB4367]|uniref:YciI family protein n=1 Tax=Paenibacillus sp. MBLB4367 TaxID=3384767 RepID=UPI0039081A91
MRFMLIVKATGYSETGVNHSREHNEERIAYKKSLAKAGALLAAEALQPSSTGIRISYPAHGGEPELRPGPFPADQELIAEYTLIEVETEVEALNWALRMPVSAGRGECEIELRRLEDYSGSLRDPRLQAMEADLQDQLNMLQTITNRGGRI